MAHNVPVNFKCAGDPDCDLYPTFAETKGLWEQIPGEKFRTSYYGAVFCFFHWFRLLQRIYDGELHLPIENSAK